MASGSTLTPAPSARAANLLYVRRPTPPMYSGFALMRSSSATSEFCSAFLMSSTCGSSPEPRSPNTWTSSQDLWAMVGEATAMAGDEVSAAEAGTAVVMTRTGAAMAVLHLFGTFHVILVDAFNRRSWIWIRLLLFMQSV